MRQCQVRDGLFQGMYMTPAIYLHSAMVLLDLSAAFNTVEHDILIRRLRTSYGLSGMVQQDFKSCSSVNMI